MFSTCSSDYKTAFRIQQEIRQLLALIFEISLIVEKLKD